MQTSSVAAGSLSVLQLAAVSQAVPPPVGPRSKLIVQAGAAGATVMPGPTSPQRTAPAAASAVVLPRNMLGFSPHLGTCSASPSEHNAWPQFAQSPAKVARYNLMCRPGDRGGLQGASRKVRTPKGRPLGRPSG